MNVLQTNKAYYPVIGGIETIVTTLAEGLSHAGVGVRVLVCNGSRSLRTDHVEVRGIPVTYAGTFGTMLSLPLSPSYVLALSRMKADILHVHVPFPLADASVSLLPRIRRNFSRIVVSWHSDIVRQKWMMAAYLPLLHRFLDLADRIVVATPFHISSSRILPRYKEKVEVIPYGVSLEWAAQDQQNDERVHTLRERYGSPMILFVGRLVYYKGLEYLINALSMVETGFLVIVGSGPLRGRLERQIRELGVAGRVAILPHLPEDQMREFFKACDVFVLPSTAPSEAFGLVQVEAMACGKPVISTDLSTGVTYVNRNGETGLTVPAADSSALANALRLLLSDPSLREKLGGQARERVLREFRAESMVEKTVDLYSRLTSGSVERG